jgi:hypothetical protein
VIERAMDEQERPQSKLPRMLRDRDRAKLDVGAVRIMFRFNTREAADVLRLVEVVEVGDSPQVLRVLSRYTTRPWSASSRSQGSR